MSNKERIKPAELPEGVFLRSRWSDEEGGKITSEFEITAFQNEYVLGAMLAQIGETIVEGMRFHSKGNPALMEQALSAMAEGFAKEMEML